MKTTTASAYSPCSMKRAKARRFSSTQRRRRKRGQVVDIMEALKRSMERVPAKERAARAAAEKEKKQCLELCRHAVKKRMYRCGREHIAASSSLGKIIEP